MGADKRRGRAGYKAAFMKKLSLPLKRVRREAWISVFSVVFLISLWEAAVDLRWVNSTFFPSPSTIARATVDSITSGELTGHISITMARMFAGFFAGAASGLVIGLAMGWSKEVRAFLDPIVSVIYPLPKIALLPLIILLVGIGEGPVIMIVALGAFFPVLVNCVAGVASIEPIYFDVARNYGSGKLKTFARVVLPGSLPMALAGLRLALGMSLLLTVVVEMSIATKGLGAMLWLSWQTFRIEKIYVAIVIIAILGLLLNWLLGLAGKRLAPWRGAR
jgi:ABC-type nitrate/sulfonate/bicarbonate transport system permease component